MGFNEKVSVIIYQLFGVKIYEFNESEVLSNIGIDSLDFMVLISKIEEEFGVNYSIDELENLVTIRDIMHSINLKCKE